MGGKSRAEKQVEKGRKRAISALGEAFQGPLKGLRIAPEFFGLAGAPELAETPVGKGLALQNRLLDFVSGGLTGDQQFSLPSDLRSSVLESSAGPRGTFGSPANDLAVANRFAGISEQVRAQRIQEALSALTGTGAAASVFPSASSFLQTGLTTSLKAADIQFQSGIQESQAAAQSAAQTAALISGVAGGLLGGGLGLSGIGTGGLSGLSGLGIGAGVGSGILPSSFAAGSDSFGIEELLQLLGQDSQNLQKLIV